MSKYQYLLIILTIIKQIISQDTIFNIKDFRSNPMGIAQREDLFRVNLGIPKESRILAYVDFNNDKYVDIISAVRNPDETETLKFYKYDFEEGVFEEDTTRNFQSYPKEFHIKNLLANDLNNDSDLDLILTLYNTVTDKTTTEVHVFNSETNSYTMIFSKDSIGIFFSDFDGDRLVDMIYYDDLKRERKFVQFKNQTYEERPFSESFFSNSTLCDGNDYYSRVQILEGHSSAFVDIDADCQNDLIIFSRDKRWDPTTSTTVSANYVEIWRGTVENNQVKYCLTKSSVFRLDNKLGPFTIADINRDGLLDIVFPILNTANVFISYNKINLQYDWSADYCKTHSNINLTNMPEVFDSLGLDSNSNFTSIISLSDNNEEFYQDKTYSPLIRIGDINSDSFPDLLAVTKEKNSERQFTRVYLNTDIKDSNAPKDSKPVRSFRLNNTYQIPVNNTVQASFFDLDENGQLDILLVVKEQKGSDVVYNTIGFYNNYIYDAFFLKSVTLLSRNVFFSNELGANYRFISTNLDGSRRMDVSFQGIQTGNAYLNLPSAFIGIGRSNNYIENFHVISNIFTADDQNYKVFTPIIPNSQLIISKILDTSSEPPTTLWELDLIVKPTSQLFILVITIAVILVVILAIIIYLHIKEVQEDQETENKNFIAWYS